MAKFYKRWVIKDVIYITAEAWKDISSGTFVKSRRKIRNEAGEETEQIIIDKLLVLQEWSKVLPDFKLLTPLLSRNGLFVTIVNRNM